MNIIEVLEQEQLRSDIPEFKAGDTVKVYCKIVEGTRERVQLFEGVVISRSGSGVRENFRSSYFLRRWRRKNFPGSQPAY